MEITRDNLLTLIQSGIKREGLSISGLEKDAHVPKDTIRDFLRGKTQILRADKLQKIMRILAPQDTVAVSGIIREGCEIHFNAESPSELKNQEQVECPPGFDAGDVVAVRIRGDSMLPVFHDGWIIYYSQRDDVTIPAISGGWQVPYNKPVQGGDDRFAEFIGKPSIIGMADGRTFIGTLKRSPRSKNYRLTNYNDNDLTNIAPFWAAKIIFIKPA